MVNASRDLQLKLQKNLRKSNQHITEETPAYTSQEMEAIEKEKKRLETQLSIVSDKLQFFSNEYQRVTELYVNEKSKNDQMVSFLCFILLSNPLKVL